MTLTYNECQIKLQEIFNKLSDLSVKITFAKNEKTKLVKALGAYEKSKVEYNTAYKQIKNSNFIEIPSFKEAVENKNKIENLVTQTKISKLSVEGTIKKLAEEIKLLNKSYRELEVKQKKALNNVLVFNGKR